MPLANRIDQDDACMIYWLLRIADIAGNRCNTDDAFTVNVVEELAQYCSVLTVLSVLYSSRNSYSYSWAVIFALMVVLYTLHSVLYILNTASYLKTWFVKDFIMV